MLQRVGYNRVVPGSVAVQSNTSGDSAMGGAIAQAGGAIAEVGDVFAQIAEQKQSALNRKHLAEANRAFNESATEFKLSLGQEGDRNNFPKVWTQQKSALSKRLKIESAPPVVREQLGEAMKDHESRMQILLQTEDARRVADEAQAAVSAAVDSHIKNGDILMAQEEIRAAQTDGVYSAEAAGKAIRDLDHKADRQSASDAITASPIEAMEALNDKTDGGKFRNFKSLSDSERRAFVNTARSENNRRATEFISEVMLTVRRDGANQEQRLEFWEQVEVQRMNGEVSEGQALTAYNYLFPKNNLPNWSTVSKLAELVDTAPVGAPEFSDDVLKIRQQIFSSDAPNSEKDRLIRRLDDKLQNVDSFDNREDVAEMNGFISRQLRKGVFGAKDIQSDEYPDSAYKKAYDLRRESTRMLKEGKSIEEVQRHILNLNSEKVMANIHSILGEFGSVGFVRDYPSEQPEQSQPAPAKKERGFKDPQEDSPFNPLKVGL